MTHRLSVSQLAIQRGFRILLIAVGFVSLTVGASAQEWHPWYLVVSTINHANDPGREPTLVDRRVLGTFQLFYDCNVEAKRLNDGRKADGKVFYWCLSYGR